MAAKDDSSDLLVLRRKPRFTGWLGLGWRFAAMFFLLGLLVLIHWIERDGLKDNYDGSVSFLDVIYFTMISATTTGYGDIVPVADRTRLFDAIVVTPIRVLFLLILGARIFLRRIIRFGSIIQGRLDVSIQEGQLPQHRALAQLGEGLLVGVLIVRIRQVRHVLGDVHLPP